MEKITIVISTNNAHKLKEYREIFNNYSNINVVSLKDENIEVDPDENGTTFEENSLIKAREVSKYTKHVVISDDSGLEIDALDGFPGIYSSRFMENSTYKEKFVELFKMLKDKNDRVAQFTCVITMMNLEKEPLYFKGIVRGEIADKVGDGIHGFGYDPIFIPCGFDVPFSEISDEIKNDISHRGVAAKKLVQYLKDHNYIS